MTGLDGEGGRAQGGRGAHGPEPCTHSAGVAKPLAQQAGKREAYAVCKLREFGCSL